MTGSARTPEQAARVVVDDMLAVDAFSRWLGVEVLEAAPGLSRITMVVRDEMVNGFGTSHGGIVFSFADSALAFCTNAGGFISVAVDCSVSYTRPVHPGDRLTATAVEESSTNSLAFCNVTVRNQEDVIVGHFRGTVHRTRHRHVSVGPSVSATAAGHLATCPLPVSTES
ncbi:MAG TPA: hotdog fold thioesterase [Gemmatimonas sp.]|nr:hotdog fold thioesterase [Gemmatimonas sp.]